MKQLNPYQTQLMTLKAKIAVKGKKEPLFNSYSEDIGKMLQLLDSYMHKGNMAIAEVEGMPSDADDDEVGVIKVALEALVAQCEHHLGGVKGAKTRFSGLLA